MHTHIHARLMTNQFSSDIRDVISRPAEQHEATVLVDNKTIRWTECTYSLEHKNTRLRIGLIKCPQDTSQIQNIPKAFVFSWSCTSCNPQQINSAASYTTQVTRQTTDSSSLFRTVLCLGRSITYHDVTWRHILLLDSLILRLQSTLDAARDENGDQLQPTIATHPLHRTHCTPHVHDCTLCPLHCAQGHTPHN